MSSIKALPQPQSMLFQLHETRPWGTPDINRECTVALDPQVSVKPGDGKPNEYSETALFWIPERGQWIGFHLTSYQEMSVGPNLEEYFGPYLIDGIAPPDKEVVANAQAGGYVINRTVNLFPVVPSTPSEYRDRVMSFLEVNHGWYTSPQLAEGIGAQYLGDLVLVLEELTFGELVIRRTTSMGVSYQSVLQNQPWAVLAASHPALNLRELGTAKLLAFYDRSKAEDMREIAKAFRDEIERRLNK